MTDHKTNLMRDLAIIALSVVVAIVLVKTGFLADILTSTQEMKLLGSFIAGLFFTSIFTVVPATAVLGEIAQSNSIFLTAIMGGAGALIGDFLIFRFVRDELSEDFLHIIGESKSKKPFSIFRPRPFKWLIPFLGAIVIASPLPDELGLLMMGSSKMKTSLFLPISFSLNSLGILVIGIIARAA